MNPWDTYFSRINAKGGTRRGTMLQREQRFLRSKLPATLSFHQMLVGGEERDMAVANSDNFDTKTIYTMPGESFEIGELVEWVGNHWLITSKDFNNEVYTKGTMEQCNYLLRWIADDNSIIERWCIVGDGTNYVTGESDGDDNIAVRGSSRLSMTIARDEYTVQLNRTNRFLIDDYDSKNVFAYRLTKPLKLGGSYNGVGVLSFVLSECNTEDTDNFELHIANYYDHFPKKPSPESVKPASADADMTGTAEGAEEPPVRKVWI